MSIMCPTCGGLGSIKVGTETCPQCKGDCFVLPEDADFSLDAAIERNIKDRLDNGGTFPTDDEVLRALRAGKPPPPKPGDIPDGSISEVDWAEEGTVELNNGDLKGTYPTQPLITFSAEAVARGKAVLLVTGDFEAALKAAVGNPVIRPAGKP